LEFKVVTADGKYVIANQRSNQNLFNALRGGGGGTFGVVVEATFKAHKTPKIAVSYITVNDMLLIADDDAIGSEILDSSDG